MEHISGLIVPVKDHTTKYPLNSNTFFITTESVTNGNDRVSFFLFDNRNSQITSISWRFSDWGYIIYPCTHGDYSLKLPVAPPTGVNKTWQITATPEHVKVKCNTLEVLYFIFNTTKNAVCTRNVEGKAATKIVFSGSDTATKTFTSEFVGK